MRDASGLVKSDIYPGPKIVEKVHGEANYKILKNLNKIEEGPKSQIKESNPSTKT